jgi:hypothetical protein
MIVIGNKVFAIVPLDDPCSLAMVKSSEKKIQEIVESRNENIPLVNLKEIFKGVLHHSEQKMIKIIDKILYIKETDKIKESLNHVELAFYESKMVIYKPKNWNTLFLSAKLKLREPLITWWRISVKDAEIIYGHKAIWVCPD